ncbi:MAG: tRNA pseudouridine(38-40) synthase TruA [Ruminococcaceae bacterium]|nr:tRNA pseudouridine(38-40) synthase TruA [Oscillospiraceae bacterium]
MRNIRLKICYDGTRYKGWQRLPGVENTIQGRLEQTLTRILEENIEISGSGRTDAGAHAIGQVANFHCQGDMSCEEILCKLRRYLPEDIGIESCQEASPRFHARLNCKTKTYHYRIWNSEKPCVFQRRYVYVLPGQLNLEEMKIAAAQFVGEHDFSAFCANKRMKKSTVRRIDSVTVARMGEEIVFEFTGDGFLYNMIRIMVGTLLEVGSGKRNADTIPALFGDKREKAGYLVPAQGLCLMEVTY